MIDLHSHVLPGLDDGAESLEVSLTMLEAAAGAGITDIAATPHADTRHRFLPDRVTELVGELNQRMEGCIRLHYGCEFHLTHDNVQDALAHPRRYTLAGGSYLLLELSNLVIFPNTADLFTLLESAGMRIIVAHPECNPILRRRPELIEEWIPQGRYLQLTGQSLTGTRGESAQRFSRLLLDRGWAHFVASDTHDPVFRPPDLRPAYDWLCREYNEALASALLVDNPGKVLRDEMVSVPAAAVQPRRNWLQRVLLHSPF
jgi:protein-tyrosine phosphatase